MSALNKDAVLLGPVSQLLTLRNLPDKGPIRDEGLEIIHEGGIVIRDGTIARIGPFKELKSEGKLIAFNEPVVMMPGFIDAHTHLCFAGSRASDYSLRIGGMSYQEILSQGGGIYDSVEKTRQCPENELLNLTLSRLQKHLSEGITTCEVKSGYGLSVDAELKMLRVIREANKSQPVSLIATCLAAHVPAKEFGDAKEYLQYLIADLLPVIKNESLAGRIDIFVEPGAFPVDVAEVYLEQARRMAFDLTVHADQFTPGGSTLAVNFHAASADHLESVSEAGISAIAKSETTATVLPGASLGLGMHFAPARKLLDGGCRVAIASDWNPGSAPMGDLLIEASVISAYEKLSHAETLAGITVRAAKALQLPDRGSLAPGMRADFVAFPVSDYREILYHQGKLKPQQIWVGGEEVVLTRMI
jgi:imidazolonepropionase